MFQMLADELVGHDSGDERTIRWGQVISVSPTLVRFAGDTVDTQVDLYIDGYTATTTDKVLLVKVGGQWVVIGKIV